MAHWYIKKDDRTLGPFGPTEMRRRVEMGKVKPETMVRKGSDSKFLAAKSFKGLIKDSDVAVQADAEPSTGTSAKPDANELEFEDAPTATETPKTEAQAAAKEVAPEISSAAELDAGLGNENDTLELAGKTTAVTDHISNNTGNDLLDTSDTERLIPVDSNPVTARTTRIAPTEAGVPRWLLKISKAYLILGCAALVVCLVSALRS